MTSVKPALTAEEWANHGGSGVTRGSQTAHISGHRVLIEDDTQPGVIVADLQPEILHALAALCLHGQPFGFTREDVALLRSMVDGVDWLGWWYEGDQERFAGIVDRIAALLPPEES